MNKNKHHCVGRFAAGLILLAIAAAGAGWFWQRPCVQAPQYQTARVVAGDLIQWVTASGQLNPVVNVLVGSQVSGTIQKLFVDYNSIVTNNQVIVQLDAAVYLAAVHQSQGELNSAKAALELAQLNAKRAQALFAESILSDSEYSSNLTQGGSSLRWRIHRSCLRLAGERTSSAPAPTLREGVEVLLTRT